MQTLGHESHGEGLQRVIVLHDWMGDHRNYAAMRPHLDGAACSYAFADLRGYGLSRERPGRYDLQEAADDVLALAAQLGWSQFHLVGHSMSSLVAQQVAASAPEKVASLVLITPVAPAGMGAPAEVIGFLERMAMDEDLKRRSLADAVQRRQDQRGHRLPEGWVDRKLGRWRESALPEASRGYVRMFASSAVSGATRRGLPVLAIAGDHDNEPFQPATIRAGLSGVYAPFELVVFESVGHYPAEEAPQALAAAVERFLRAHPHPDPSPVAR